MAGEARKIKKNRSGAARTPDKGRVWRNPRIFDQLLRDFGARAHVDLAAMRP
jgi:hypothetical protein